MGTDNKIVSSVVSTKRRASSAWVGCLLAVACGGELPQQTSGAGTAATDSAAAEPQASPETLLAEIQLSPTHRIEFVQKAHGAAVGVRETLHVDHDGIETGLAAAGVESSMPLDEIYVIASAATGQVDWQVAERLRETQLRFDDAQPVNVELPGAFTNLDGDAPSAVSESSDSPPVDVEVANAAEKVATHQAALCGEPSPFDWALDELWFKQNFCRINFKYCDGLDPSHRSGNQQKHAEAHYFNQSFCSNASWKLTYRFATACDPFGCTRRIFTADSGTLAPRTLTHEYWTSGKGADGKYNQWTAEITSAQGNFTALSYFGYTN